MKIIKQSIALIFFGAFIALPAHAFSLLSHKSDRDMYDTIRIDSRVNGLKLAMLHSEATSASTHEPVLFIHGASFPSALAAGFLMQGHSWMDHLNQEGYETFALDFLGYGNADRYPEMLLPESSGQPLGRAHELIEDVIRAVDYILLTRKATQVTIIAHSWGGTVAALYASHHPEKIKSLVLFASLAASPESPQTKQDTPHERHESMTPDDRVKAMMNLTPPGETCGLEPELYTDWKKQWLASDPLAKRSQKQMVTFPSGWKADVHSLEHGQSYFDLSKITARTLVIRGEWDRFPSNEDANRMFEALKNSSHKKYVVIERSTHVAHLEKNRIQLYQEVTSFLKPSTPTGPVAVIFEVVPSDAGRREYLDLAGQLKPELLKIKGFISVERYQSLSETNKILSLSFWQDEEAVKEWRNTETHRLAQSKGRNGIFKDYRLRVVSVIRDYGMHNRTEAPRDSKKIHDPGKGK